MAYSRASRTMSAAAMPVHFATLSADTPELFRAAHQSRRYIGNVIGIVEALVDDDVHHAERQGAIGSGIDGKIPVSAGCGARTVRIDDYQLGAIFDGHPK